ncbi:MAG: Na/Pi cotransporter family protein [bacterium]
MFISSLFVAVLLLIAPGGAVCLATQQLDSNAMQDSVVAESTAPAETVERDHPPTYSLEHPRDPVTGKISSGDKQSGIVGRVFRYPLVARVVDDTGRPTAGVRVEYNQVAPEIKHLGEKLSDQDGLVRLTLMATEKATDHTVVAKIVGSTSDREQIVFNLPVRKSSWGWFMLFGLAGGLGLFLFGMGMMSRALQRTAGSKMRAILDTLTINRFVGVAVGAFVTIVIQSSSATTVMLVSFVQAQLISFSQTLGVILGADIGTTVTTQLIAFKLTDYALLLVAVGFGVQLLGKGRNLHNVGTIVLGFGLLFYGMHVMSEAMYPLRSYQPFLDLLVRLENPILGILVGTAFTALIQSSAAFAGIVIVLAQQGLLSLTAGLPLVLGANIGTCITATLAAMNAGREAKRVALAHTLFKVIGVLIFIWWIPSFADLVRRVSPGHEIITTDPVTMARLIPRQIANAHTIFNVGLTMIFLPFTVLFARIIMRLLPDEPLPEIEEKHRAKHLELDLLSTPSLALNLAKVEILRLGELSRDMAVRSLDLFLSRNLNLCDELHEMEEKADALDEQITSYLMKVSQQNLNEEQAHEVYMMLHVTKQFEQVADTVDKQLIPLVRKMIEQNAEFSDSGRDEVRAYHLKMTKQLSRALEVFREGSLEKAQRMTKKMASYIELEGEYRQAHFRRIRDAVKESVTSSEIHLELMDCLRRISSYSTNVARAIIAKPHLEG